MEEHISFEDMVAFVWMQRLTPELKQLTLKVNCHLMVCDQCAQEVEKLQQIYADGRELHRRQEAERVLQARQAKIIPLFPEQVAQVGESTVYAASQPRTFVIEEGEIPPLPEF